MKFGREADPEAGSEPAGSPAPVATADGERTEPAAEAVPEPAGNGSTVGTSPANGAVAAPARPVISGKDVKTLVVACDAGMGSSVMLASQLRTRLKPYGVSVEHVSINQIPAETRLVLTHTDLADRARATVPHAVVVEFRMFLGDPVFDEVEKAIKEGGEIRG
jgi:PTS system mannitol-specific IIC component